MRPRTYSILAVAPACVTVAFAGHAVDNPHAPTGVAVPLPTPSSSAAASSSVSSDATPAPGPVPSVAVPALADPATTDTSQLACFPKCRSGYVCHQGRCVSRCNPPCEPGTVCTAEHLCVALANSWPHPSPAANAPVQHRPTQDRLALDREIARQERLKYRMNPRLTVQGRFIFGGLADMEVMFVGVTGSVGFRQNLKEHFGLQVRAGLAVAGTLPFASSTRSSRSTGYDGYDDDTAVMTHYYGEAGPYFGPFGRFYLGPIVWAGRYTFSRDTLVKRDADGDPIDRVMVPDGWKAGGGLDMGILALRHEQLDINWRVKSSFSDQVPLTFEAGVGFHFM